MNPIKIVPGLMALSLAGNQYKRAMKKKKSTKDFLEGGFEAITGTALIQAEAQLTDF